MHFDSKDSRQWINHDLTEMLNEMNVQEEYAIAGRTWLSESRRMIKRGYKVIIVISKDAIKDHLEVMLNHVIFNQNSEEPCIILIMYKCTRDDLHENIKSMLRPYVLLYHNDNNFCDRLKQAINHQNTS